ncbi:MAG: glycosyltransferase, partial [Bacteroidota bacterium]
YAIYNPQKDEFNLQNITHYRINQLNQEEINNIFDSSIAIIKEIIHYDFPNYKISGFRAGGWSIQPFEVFKESFQKHKIVYDFSVMPLVYQFTDAQHFDFSTCVKSNIYRFSDKVEEQDDKGSFIEITSDIIYIEPWRKLIDKIYLKYLYKVLDDSTHLKGIGVRSNEISIKPKSPFGINLATSNYERVSIELLTRIKLANYKKLINNQEFVQFVSHPKILTKHNIKMLKCLLKFANNHFIINSDFRYFSKSNLKPINQSADLNSHSRSVTANGDLSTEKMSTISVVIPCYNVAPYIKEAIESVIQQTKPCEEIICVDDCSSDTTVTIIKELQNQYPTIIKLLQN